MSIENQPEDTDYNQLANDVLSKIDAMANDAIPKAKYQRLLRNIDITFELLDDLGFAVHRKLVANPRLSESHQYLTRYKFTSIFPSLGMELIVQDGPPRKMTRSGATKNKATEVLFSKNYRLYKGSATEIPDQELKLEFVALWNNLDSSIERIDKVQGELSAKANKTKEEISELRELEKMKKKVRSFDSIPVISAQFKRSPVNERKCSKWFDNNYLTWATELVGLTLGTQTELVIIDEELVTLCYDSDDESGTPLKYPIRVDYTIKTSSTGDELEAIAVVEMKNYAVLDFGSKDIIFKNSFHPYFHQLSAYMLLNKVNCGFLSNGLELAYFEFDFSRTIDFDAIPVRFKILDNRSSGLTMRMLLAAVLYKRLNRTEEEKRNELKGLRIFKKTFGNSMEQIIKEIRRCVQEYLITKGLNISQYKLIEIEDKTKVQRLQAGFEYHSQVITIPKTEFLRQFPQDAIDLEALRSSDENIVLKIYDISYTIVACEPNELKYNEILSISRSQCNTESALYNKIRRINQNSDDRIVTARVFGVFENLQILVKDKYYFVGDVIAMEEFTVQPKTAEDFDKGLQQLKLLHRNGIVHNDVKYDNMFMNDKNEFVYIDFGFSRSGDLLRSEQLFETDRERMVTDSENWMKTRNKIVGDAAGRNE